MLILGVDTSAYRTSLALVNERGKTVGDERRLVEVAQGGRGLRQSEALFQHVNALPELTQRLLLSAGADASALAEICVSSRPRDIEGSYMPVFNAGISYAQTLSAWLSVPLCFTSHQKNHIMSAYSSAGMSEQHFLAAHVSGGTTEVLEVDMRDGRFDIALLGGTIDLHAGQLVDRVGVRLGLPFPAGQALEELARGTAPADTFTTSVSGLNCSFSGAENQAMRLIERGERHETVAAMTLDLIGRTLMKALARAAEQTGLDIVLITGGVAANMRIRELLGRKLGGLYLRFADARMCGDNAVGTALIGLKNIMEGNR